MGLYHTLTLCINGVAEIKWVKAQLQCRLLNCGMMGVNVAGM